MSVKNVSSGGGLGLSIDIDDTVEIVEEVPLRCSNCNVPLVNIISTKRKSGKRRVKVNTSYRVIECYKCKSGGSFKSKVFNTDTSIGEISDHVSVELVDTVEEKDGSLTCLVRTKKRVK